MGAQTENVEIIVVDNDSRDDTVVLAKRSGATVLIGGPERSDQRNIGLAYASGDVVCFIDSDQLVEPEVSAQLRQAFERSEVLGAAVIPERSFGVGYLAKCRSLERQLIDGDQHAEAARAFRTSAIRAVGGYRVGNVGFEDVELPDRLRELGWKIVRIAARVWHDEGRVKLLRLFRKKLYYGRSLPDYIGAATVRRVLFRTVRPSYLNFRVLARHATYFPGLVFLKLIDFTAIAAGAALELASSLRGRDRY